MNKRDENPCPHGVYILVGVGTQFFKWWCLYCGLLDNKVCGGKKKTAKGMLEVSVW